MFIGGASTLARSDLLFIFYRCKIQMWLKKIVFHSFELKKINYKSYNLVLEHQDCRISTMHHARYWTYTQKTLTFKSAQLLERYFPEKLHARNIEIIESIFIQSLFIHSLLHSFWSVNVIMQSGGTRGNCRDSILFSLFFHSKTPKGCHYFINWCHSWKGWIARYFQTIYDYYIIFLIWWIH